mmetsp:Transcript_1255/g.2690  ORF Transcript_1255/g.2690 Transcript_1255/m.2690 type:complete len:251 (-) Transcript_1255:570-1322(-)
MEGPGNTWVLFAAEEVSNPNFLNLANLNTSTRSLTTGNFTFSMRRVKSSNGGPWSALTTLTAAAAPTPPPLSPEPEPEPGTPTFCSLRSRGATAAAEAAGRLTCGVFALLARPVVAAPTKVSAAAAAAAVSTVSAVPAAVSACAFDKGGWKSAESTWLSVHSTPWQCWCWPSKVRAEDNSSCSAGPTPCACIALSDDRAVPRAAHTSGALSPSQSSAVLNADVAAASLSRADQSCSPTVGMRWTTEQGAR